MQTSSRWAPSRVWSRAISTQSSQRSSSIASRNALRAVGVGALADRQVRRVLAERHVLVERRDAGLGPRPARGEPAAADPLDDLAQVLGRRAAAAADEGEAEVAGEVVVRVGQLLRASAGRARRRLPSIGQAGVGHAGQADRGRAATRWRRCSLISAGPVAQLRPIRSMPSGSSAVSAAPISEPSSIVPVVSTVTWHDQRRRRTPAAVDAPAGRR